MKRFRKIFQNLLVCILFFIFCNSCVYESEEVILNFDYESIVAPSYSEIHEIDSRFIITPMQEIIFSSNQEKGFKLFKYFDETISEVELNYDNIFYPALLLDEVHGLYDNEGDERFRVTKTGTSQILDSEDIKSMMSSPNGNYLLYIVRQENDLYLLNLRTRKNILISDNFKSINAIHFDTSEEFFVYAKNELIYKYNIRDEFTDKIEIRLGGEKLNLYTANNILYFVSHDSSQYYNIYKHNLTNNTSNTELVLSTNKDLRIPKVHNGKLYFIEVINGEYLLKYMDFEEKKITSLTESGVVYNYEFFEDNIICNYSDFYTPRCLLNISLSRKSEPEIIYGSKTNLDLSYHYIKANPSHSDAYIFNPPDSIKIVGNILFIHPGLHGDFSPRWDNTLMGLCLNGYRIFAPNYPGSCGYGKSYYNENIKRAIVDLLNWKNQIRLNNKELPFYILAASSGCILMERMLLKNNSKINAVGSLFGITTKNEVDNTVPCIYVLGQNDPIVDYQKKYNQLNEISKPKKVISFTDEGHWIRKPQNMMKMVKEIVAFYRAHTNE